MKEKENNLKRIIYNLLLSNKFLVFLALVVVFVTTGICFKSEIENFINKTTRNYNDYIESGLTIYFLDVGQGDCSFIEFPDGKTMLIDSGTDRASKYVIDFLINDIYKNKELVIDHLLLTHSDTDHSGGMLQIMQNFSVKNVYRPRIYDCYNNSAVDLSRDNISLNVYASENNLYYHNLIESFYNEPGCSVYFTSASEMNNITWCNNVQNNYNLTFFSPTKSYYGDDEFNDFSPVFQIEYNNKKVMFTGDASSEIEEELLQKQILNKVDVLKVAHHGSKNSTSSSFVNTVSPEYSIISVGKDNSYNHPTNDVLNVLTLSNSKIYRTDKNGTIVLNINNNSNINIFTLSNGKFYVKVEYLIAGLIIISSYLLFFVGFLDILGKKNLKEN